MHLSSATGKAIALHFSSNHNAVVLVVVYITIAFNYVPITTNRFVDHPVSEASREIAARLTKSKQEVPHYYLSVDIEVNTNPTPSLSFSAYLNSIFHINVCVSSSLVHCSILVVRSIQS